jgi:DNA helicase IV
VTATTPATLTRAHRDDGAVGRQPSATRRIQHDLPSWPAFELNEVRADTSCVTPSVRQTAALDCQAALAPASPEVGDPGWPPPGQDDEPVVDNWTGRGWSVSVVSDRLLIQSSGKDFNFDAAEATAVKATRSWWRWSIVGPNGRLCRTPGLRPQDADEINRAALRLASVVAVDVTVRWCGDVRAMLTRHREEQRWIAHEPVDELLAGRPDHDTVEQVRAARDAGLLTDVELDRISLLDADILQLVADTNEAILEAELDSRQDLLNRIEASPLTVEQATAVICYDNRVQVVAAAGSGKTSVMVARVGYALHRAFTTPERILVLAFNTAAAAELQERIHTRLSDAGIDSTGIKATTFHAFGLDVIGKATNRKPRVAPWIEQNDDRKMVERIVNDLRGSSPTFRYKWDLYRLLFAGAPTSLDEGDADSWDRDTRTAGFRTYRGEIVKSAGERMIANWLYLNGVEYEYERPYDVDTATADHVQYQPDFYYPAIDAWHEHWALDRNGHPPDDFNGYANGMSWKRDLHRTHGTSLIETSWAAIVFGDGFEELGKELTARGITLVWDPQRPISTVEPVKPADMFRLMRTFMSHVKSNSLTEADIRQRLAGERKSLAGYRTNLFLDLYWPIQAEWDRRLRADNCVDFEDMLLLAANHLASGDLQTDYDLVLVDEFQDASRARAQLVQELVRKPGRHLLVVGDDWQAVNRFAGADISVMTEFHDWFGLGPNLQLTATFRCPQSICDVASRFISSNPRQIRKTVSATQNSYGPPVRLVQTDDTRAALASCLEELADAVDSGAVEAGPDGTVSVLVLGRYHFEHSVLPSQWSTSLDVSFRTAHGSKGLEADYVIIPNLAKGTYGFPSQITDDPVLDIVMASPDPYPHAEERRLFYVALTRARRHVTLITERGRESAFAVELLHGGGVEVAATDGPAAAVQLCSSCGLGTMVSRTGPYGAFLGCSRFPACTATAAPQAPTAVTTGPIVGKGWAPPKTSSLPADVPKPSR